MARCLAGGLLCLTVASGLAAAQQSHLEAIRAVPEMTARARQALDFAAARLEAAAQAYKDHDLEAGRDALGEIGDAVELAVEALEATGKHPRRNPRHFKNAEIRTRRLLGQIRQLRRRAHPGDHSDLDGLIERVETANGKLLLGIMSARD